MYQEMPNFTTEGGGSFFSGASDVLTAAVFDPATIVGLGFGGPIGSALTAAVKQAGKGATTRAILRQAMKGNMGKITAMTSVEGLLGAMGESQRQEIKVEVDLMASKDWEMIGTMGAVSGVASLVGFPLGVAGAKKALATAGMKSGDEKVAERLAKAKVTKGKVKEDFKKVLIKYAIQHEGYPTFKVAFKGVRGVGSSAALEKKSVKVMRPPLNSNIAGGGHESHCFVYYVFMSKAFQVFWRANTTLQAGARKQRLLKELLNKY